jgi:NRAMP (natural resistance-associated macrophage protein)-like metal ion transporter
MRYTVAMFARLKRWAKIIGPGVTTGAADDDPSGVATYAQAGARFGYTPLWTLLFSFPLMFAVQEMCARIVLVTGKGLGRNIREYSKLLVVPVVLLLFIANIVNIAADLLMMAEAARLIVPVTTSSLLVVFTLIGLCLEIFLPYRTYAKYLKWLTLALLAYIIVAFVWPMDWSAALTATVIPSFVWDKDFIYLLLAILGTTISPYLFFWQAGQELEEERMHRHHHASSGKNKKFMSELRSMRIDTAVGMLLSNIVAWFIMLTAAGMLHAGGVGEIHSAADIARLLVPVAGHAAGLVFALGIIGVGLLAVPVLAGSTAYAVSEAFGWKNGLDRPWYRARGFYGVIVCATLLGLLFSLMGFAPIDLLVASAALNGAIGAPLLIAILLIANDKKRMGTLKNGLWSNIWNGLTVVGLSLATIALIVQSIRA